MARGHQILLSKSSWLDICRKTTFNAWTIPEPIKSDYQDGSKRLFFVEFSGLIFKERLTISSGKEIQLPKYISKLIEAIWEENPDRLKVVFTALDLSNSDEDEKKESVIDTVAIGIDTVAMAKARIGHAKFREELMKYWDNKCAVLGAENPKSGGFLIASHIVPWSEANKIDKVNPFNGLLLSPHLDRLFDSGYISFDDEGVIIYKPEYQYLLQQMSIPLDAKLRKLNKNKHLPFLQRHREIYGFK